MRKFSSCIQWFAKIHSSYKRQSLPLTQDFLGTYAWIIKKCWTELLQQQCHLTHQESSQQPMTLELSWNPDHSAVGLLPIHSVVIACLSLATQSKSACIRLQGSSVWRCQFTKSQRGSPSQSGLSLSTLMRLQSLFVGNYQKSWWLTGGCRTNNKQQTQQQTTNTPSTQTSNSLTIKFPPKNTVTEKKRNRRTQQRQDSSWPQESLRTLASWDHRRKLKCGPLWFYVELESAPRPTVESGFERPPEHYPILDQRLSRWRPMACVCFEVPVAWQMASWRLQLILVIENKHFFHWPALICESVGVGEGPSEWPRPLHFQILSVKKIIHFSHNLFGELLVLDFASSRHNQSSCCQPGVCATFSWWSHIRQKGEIRRQLFLTKWTPLAQPNTYPGLHISC